MSLFTDKAPGIMRLLMRDFGLDDLSAAAIVGNLGHESGGFRFLQEKKPLIPGSKGGYGWAQWTGPRRRQYEAYCKRNALDPASDKANYGFLFVELTGSEKAAIPAVKAAVGLAAKVKAFEMKFERAGIKHYPSRNNYATQALRAYHAAEPPKTTEAKTKDAAKAGGGAVVAGTVATGAQQGWGALGWAVAAGCLIILAVVAAGAFYWWRHRRVVPNAVPSVEAGKRIAEAKARDDKAIAKLSALPIWVSETRTVTKPAVRRGAKKRSAARKKPAKKRAA